MKFLQKVKEEILNKNLKDKCCKKAFLAGLIRASGEIFSSDNGLGFDFSLPTEESVNQISYLFKVLFGFEIRELSVFEDKLNKKDKFVLSVTGEEAETILKEIGVLKEDGDDLVVDLDFYGFLGGKDCCVRSFIRGLFVSSGLLTTPYDTKNVNTRYHLEITFSHPQTSMDTSEVLRKNGVNTKILKRKDRYVVYIKSAEEIKNFLAFIGANVSVLTLTDMIINGELANVSNRRANCDVANVTRQLEAVEKHIVCINKIEKCVGLKSLKPDLLETAIKRREYPSDTLSELAERLGVTKSCLNHRLRKLVSIAENL